MVPRITALIETTILMDLSKNDSQAVAWLQSQNTYFGISLISKMEVLQGAKTDGKINSTEYSRLLKMMNAFKPCPEINVLWAYAQFEKFWKSHQVKIPDCLIASTCKELNLPIYSRDKHFSTLLGTLCINPY